MSRSTSRRLPTPTSTPIFSTPSSRNRAPDLCSIDAFFLTQYTDGLTDLSAHRAEWEDQFVPPTLDVSSYLGKLYAVPADAGSIGLFYRQDLWDQYGIKEDGVATWSDLVEAGNKVNQDSNGEVSLYAMFGNDHYLYEVLAIEQGFGGYYFDDTDTKVIVDDPKMVEAVGVIKQLWDGKGALQNPGGTDIYGDELTVLIKSGKVATQIVGASWYPSSLTQQMPELSGQVAPDAAAGDRGRWAAHWLPIPNDPRHPIAEPESGSGPRVCGHRADG